MTTLAQLKATAYELDVFDFLKRCEGYGFAACVTDLPYPTKERHRSRGTKTRLKVSEGSNNPWFGVLSIADLCRALEGIYKALAGDSYAYVYVDDDTYLLLAAELGVTTDLDRLIGMPTSQAPRDAIGFGWWTPATWVKTVRDPGACDACGEPVPRVAGGMGYHGAQSTERILILEKGKLRMRERFNNAFLSPRPSAKPKGATLEAATPKPPEIAAQLVRATTPPGGVVFDPFIGCGTHLKGFRDAGCHAIVNDVNLATFRDWTANVFDIPVDYR